jgi:galactose mutarotase-like enzyme
MPCEHSIHEQDGITVHHLDTPEVKVRIIPELGAKIAGLLDKRTGREWMWSPPGGGLFRSAFASAFDQSTLTGADECLPTIAACKWNGRELPDHGELWSLPWKGETIPHGLKTTLQCAVSPFLIERTATLEANRLKLDYRLVNQGAQPEPFIWALHPLMTILTGDRLEIPACEMELEVALGRDLGERGAKIAWPHPAPGMDLALMDFGPGGGAALKGFVKNPAEKRADIINSSGGGRMSIRFSGDSLDALGIWINRGAWNGHHHVALEPTNGSPDALDAAVKGNHHGLILPGQTLAWQVVLEVNEYGEGV